jgi:uncharacterized protein
MKELTPIQVNERIQAIDIIRGFAILGIFIVNMPAFNFPIQYLPLEKWWTSTQDQITSMLIDIFAQASFYTLFSFLFGFGTYIFYERVTAKGYSFKKYFTRRLLGLLLIGCIHAFLIWDGDILISYSLIGILLLLFHRFSPTLWIWLALTLIILPSFVLGGLLFIAVLLDPKNAGWPYDAELGTKAMEVYSSGSFLEIAEQRVHDWLYVNNFENAIFLVLALFPMFLLGMYSAKKKWFAHIEDHIKKMKFICIGAFIISCVFKLLPYYYEKNIATEFLQDSIGGPASAIFYASFLALIVRREFWRKLLSPLSFVGRMSLSNYLFQSILCTTLFYNYGFGLYGKIGPFYGFILTLFIYFIQIILSKQWFKRFNYGPIEWLWRRMTYGNFR